MLFAEIKDEGEKIGIKSYGISMTSPTQIFNKITKEEEGSEVEIPENIGHMVKVSDRLDGWPLLWQQFRGHFFKCFFYSLRNWKLIATQLLLLEFQNYYQIFIEIAWHFMKK